MDDATRIMDAIASLKELTTAKFDATNEKLDMVHSDGKRHGKDISTLYDRDREQSGEISEISKSVLPAISHASNSHKVNIAIVIAFVGAVVTSFWKSITDLIQGQG